MTRSNGTIDASIGSGSAAENEKELQIAARNAAIDIQEEFDDHSGLRNALREEAIPVYDPEEVMLHGTIHKGRFCTITRLRGISMRFNRNPPFDLEMEDHREHFADRSHDEHFVVKSASHTTSIQNEASAILAAVSLMIEALILANLAKHPHICQLYGINSSGADAPFGCEAIEHGFFIITDRIAETLPERMEAWREKKGYEGERYDALATRQSQLTQRLEVVLDICSAVLFCSDRHLVYHLHPEKVGFDSRYGRIKLFHFLNARETGNMPLQQHYASSRLLASQDMWIRAYIPPEVVKNESVTVSADVYAMGMLLWEILTLRHPCQGMSVEEHIKDVIKGDARPQLNRTWPEKLRNLMEACWSPNAKARPTMKDVFDKLEENLMFQELDGIDQTEDHSQKMSLVTKPRKIAYQPKSEESIPEEERDKDLKSIRSHKSQQSQKSNGSDDSRRIRPSQTEKVAPRRAMSVNSYAGSQRTKTSASSTTATSDTESPRIEGGSTEETTKSKATKNKASPRTGLQRASSVRLRGRHASEKLPRNNSARHMDAETSSPEVEAIFASTPAPSSRKIVYKKDSPVSAEERDRDIKSQKSTRSHRSQETEVGGSGKVKSPHGSSRGVTRRKSDSNRKEGEDKDSPRRESKGSSRRIVYQKDKPLTAEERDRDSKSTKSHTSHRSNTSGGDDGGRRRSSHDDDEKASAKRESSTKENSSSRKIVYQKDKPMTAEERDRDAKSTRSQASHRSNTSVDDIGKRHSQRSRVSSSDDSGRLSSQCSADGKPIVATRSKSAGDVDVPPTSSPRSPSTGDSAPNGTKAARTRSDGDIGPPNVQQLSDVDADESGPNQRPSSRGQGISIGRNSDTGEEENARPRSTRGESTKRLTRQRSTRNRSDTQPERQRSKRELRKQSSTRMSTRPSNHGGTSDDDPNSSSAHLAKERPSSRRGSLSKDSIYTEDSNDAPKTPQNPRSSDTRSSFHGGSDDDPNSSSAHRAKERPSSRRRSLSKDSIFTKDSNDVPKTPRTPRSLETRSSYHGGSDSDVNSPSIHRGKERTSRRRSRSKGSIYKDDGPAEPKTPRTPGSFDTRSSFHGSLDSDVNSPSVHRGKERTSRRRSVSKGSIYTQDSTAVPQTPKTPRYVDSDDAEFLPLKDHSSPKVVEGESKSPSVQLVNRSRSDGDGGRTTPSSRRGHRSRSSDRARLASAVTDPTTPNPSRGVSRSGSGTDGVILSHGVGRGSPSAHQIIRRKSGDVGTPRVAPASRGVSASKSNDGIPGVAVGGERTRGSVSRTAKPKRAMSTRDIRNDVERRTFVAERMAMSMSDHSKWDPFQKGSKEMDNEIKTSEQEEAARPDGALKPSGKDNPRSSRTRLLKDSKSAAEQGLQEKEKQRQDAYSKAVVAAVHSSDNGKLTAQRRPSRKSRGKSTMVPSELQQTLLKLAAED
jgi:hypothetical protein